MDRSKLLEIIEEKNISLSKDDVTKIEDFAIKTHDVTIATVLCANTFIANNSKMLDLVCEYGDPMNVADFFDMVDDLSMDDLKKLEKIFKRDSNYHVSSGEKWIVGESSFHSNYVVGYTQKELLESLNVRKEIAAEEELKHSKNNEENVM